MEFKVGDKVSAADDDRDLICPNGCFTLSDDEMMCPVSGKDPRKMTFVIISRVEDANVLLYEGRAVGCRWSDCHLKKAYSWTEI